MSFRTLLRTESLFMRHPSIFGNKFILGHVAIFQCSAKHWNQKYRKLRAQKVIKITLPDYDEKRREDKMSIEEIRAKLKEKGIAPSRHWHEKPIFISCGGEIVDPFIPPEGDGKISVISTPGMKQKYETIGKKGKSYLAVRKIRNIDYDFDIPTVAQKAEGIYIESNKALASKDEDKLHELVTEKAFPEMMENAKFKTIRWKFIQSLEPPRIVHVRTLEAGAKENMFAQITVRLHTQQTLAVYDRFGRLMHGSEDAVKDCLEYVVFEKHITSEHGAWRIHGKIIPDWMPPKEAIRRTYIKPDIDREFPEPPEKEVVPETTNESQPMPATA